MTLIIPPGVDAEGSVLVGFATDLADYTHPKAVEATAAGALNISCYLSKAGLKPGADVAKWSDERLCTKNVFEQLGAVTYKLDALEYIYDPQNPDSVSNKAYALMKEGVQGYLIIRWGKDVESNPDLVVGDIIDVYPVTLGPQVKQPPEANSKLKVQQEVSITGNPEFDYKLTA